ncbi:MAG: hypothetical protein LBP26_04125 [Clostridiales bacterium]|jgi:hypothetical protein|nr:hypothetical protein [Clostridiales bacterium]
MKEILFKDLAELAVEKDRVSGELTADKWQTLDYETAEGKGKLLLAGECTYPQEVTLRLNVRGWHRIYLGLLSVTGSEFTELRLSGGARAGFMPSHTRGVNGYPAWGTYEWIEEDFWRAADLTGKDIIISKPPAAGAAVASALAFLRLEPMSQKEVNEYSAPDTEKNVMYHFDTDFYVRGNYASASEYAGRVEMLKKGRGEILLLETSFDDGAVVESSPDDPFYLYGRRNIDRYMSKYLKDKTAVQTAIINKAHGEGMRVLAANRMELGDFFVPYAEKTYNAGYQDKYPGLCCRTRTGNKIAALSYAYPEARKIAVDKLLSRVQNGFDGVSLIFHRGVHVAFEKPVIDKVKELYGVDAHELPYSDARLNGVLRGYMTEFMRGLRAALDNLSAKRKRERYHVNAVVYYDADSSADFGLDVDAWARDGLIDSVSQGLMTHYEDLDGCMQDGAPSLIDLEKYRRINGTRVILKREHNDITGRVASGIPGFLDISKKYGIDFYATLAWEGNRYWEHLALAKAVYNAGAQKLIVWNGNHVTERLPVLNTVKSCADKDGVISGKTPGCVKFRRVLSIAGRDISEYNPNWRG